MNFDDFDKIMRTYEESIDQIIPKENYKNNIAKYSQ